MLPIALALALAASDTTQVTERCSWTDFGPDLTTAERVQRAEYVFTGYVLDHRPETNGVTQSDTVRFVVENRWKGPPADTVSVFIGHDCPQLARRGYTYIVAASRVGGTITASRSAGLLVPIERNTGWSRAKADTINAVLGAPAWTAPDMSKRGLEDPSPIVSVPDGVRLAVFVDASLRGGRGMSLALIGDPDRRAVLNSGFFRFDSLEAGRIYRMRLSYADGSREEDYYVRPVCGSRTYGCSDFLSLKPGHKATPLPPLQDSTAVVPGLKSALASVAQLSMAVQTAEVIFVDVASIVHVNYAAGGGTIQPSAAAGAIRAVRPDAIESDRIQQFECIALDTCPGPDTITLSIGGATVTRDSMVVHVTIRREGGHPQPLPYIEWEVRLSRAADGWTVASAVIT